MSKSVKKYLSIFFGIVLFVFTFQLYSDLFESLDDFLFKLLIFIVLTGFSILFLFLEKFTKNYSSLEIIRLSFLGIFILIDFYFFMQILLYPMVAWSMGFFIVLILDIIIDSIKFFLKIE